MDTFRRTQLLKGNITFIREYNFEHFIAFSLTALLTMTKTIRRFVSPNFHQKFVTRSRLMLVFLLSHLQYCVIYVAARHTVSAKELLTLTLIATAFLIILGLNYRTFTLPKKLRKREDLQLGVLTRSEPRNVETKERKITLRKTSTCLLGTLCVI